MPSFDFDGLTIAYDHAGNGDPVIFLHNLGADRSIWSAQLDVLQKTHSVYAIDWIGYGDSDTPDSGYTIDRYLRLLTTFIDAHGLRDVTLVGNCFGSAMSLLYARQAPENVRALVLINPLTAATLAPTKSGWAAYAFKHLPPIRAITTISLPSLIAARVVREQLGAAGRRSDEQTVDVTALRRRWTEPRRLLPIVAVLPELPRLAELDSFYPDGSFPPITTIWGEQNRVLSATAGARLNKSLKPERALTLPACGHLPSLEDPTAITDAVQAAVRTPLRAVSAL